MATPLPSLQGRQLPAAPARPLAGEAMHVEIIDISDDDEEIDWDLLRGESEQVSAEPVAKEEAGKVREKAPPATSSDSSSSSDSSEAGYCIGFHSGMPQMRRIRRPMCGPCQDP